MSADDLLQAHVCQIDHSLREMEESVVTNYTPHEIEPNPSVG
jgi:hypothetical protein